MNVPTRQVTDTTTKRETIMITEKQEKLFRAHWQKAIRKISTILKEKEDRYVTIAQSDDFSEVVCDPRTMAIGLFQIAMKEFSDDLELQLTHELGVDDLLNLYGMKPDEDNLNPPRP